MRSWLLGAPTPPARRQTDGSLDEQVSLSRLWIPGVILGLAAIAALLIVPSESSAWDFIFLVTALMGLVVLLGAALTAPGGARTIWWSLLAFQLVTMTALAVYDWQLSKGDVSFPGPSDVVSLLAYAPAFLGLGVLIHRRYPGHDREAWIDAAILTVTAVCVFGLFLIAPILGSPALDEGATFVAIAYPLLDLALLSALIWLLIGAGRPSAALTFLALSFALTLTADVLRDLALIDDPSAPLAPWVGVIRLGALVVMGAAATTPSAATVAQPRGQSDPRVTTPRLVVLAFGVLTVPVIVAARLWGAKAETTLLLALAAIIVIILAVWRIQILVSAVEQQRKVTELVLDSAGDGIVGLDRQGFVLFANLAARRMLRCRESDLIGRRFHDIAHHEHADGTPYPWQECPVSALVTTGEEAFLPDQRYVRRDGTAFPVEIVMSPLVIDGAVMGAVQSFRDVSERLEMEEIKRQFVSVVSHELRTPLTSIKGSLQMLNAGIVGPLTEDQQELVTMAVANSERLGNLVNDILDLERLDSGRMPLEPALVSAASLAQQAITGITGAAQAAGIRVEATLPDGSVPTDVIVDPHRMVQVLTNLLGNAIKFSQRGSAIHVAVAHPDDHVTIAVADRGRGIPEDQLAAVFERFGQVEGGDARREGGTGLGLAIAQEIVERSGGSISVESSMGVGSTFMVTLPAAPVHAVSEEVTS
jgi:PAS domain S-box-containing protein